MVFYIVYYIKKNLVYNILGIDNNIIVLMYDGAARDNSVFNTVHEEVTDLFSVIIIYDRLHMSHVYDTMTCTAVTVRVRLNICFQHCHHKMVRRCSTMYSYRDKSKKKIGGNFG